uniref:SHSP domain-containing protein n=1 Tax=Salix viminalis TaxID=40686 RepID=A0A6N2N0B3_SALVM
MSIVPIGNQDGTITNPTYTWDPADFFSSLDLWDPFQNFPFPPLLSTHFPAFSVFRAVFPGFGREDVLVYIDDENMLHISTEDGEFMSQFKLPDNARRDRIEGSEESCSDQGL